MKIYFVGSLISPFIKQDLELLRELHEVVAFDLSIHASSFRQCPGYLFTASLEWKQVMDSDIVYIWFADYPALPFIVLANAFGKPVVTNVGGWEVYAASDIGYGNQLNPVRGWATRFILRNSTACICMSNAYKTIIETVEPCSKVAVIPGWVDSDLCTAPLPEKRGVVTAICTNRDYNLKGIPTFKEAARFIPNMKVIKNLPHNELMEVFRKTKVYCQLSYTESFGMSLLESMACGCIPVVSNRDALPEVVADTGFIVPYGDVYKTITAILVALITDGTPARERAREFTRDKRKEKINELIGEIRS